MDDLISVVVPVYNVEQYVDKCINSIINQTYRNIEVIIVDDGSTDGSSFICEKYSKEDSRIEIIHKDNGGLSDARNRGIEISKGKYITFIDSDDYVDTDYIEVLYNAIKKYEADMSISTHKILFPNKTVNKYPFEEYISTKEDILDKLLYDEGIDTSVWGKLYKISLFKDIRFPRGRLFEDAATTYKLIDKSNRIAVYSKPTYNYVIRENSISNVGFSEKKLDLIKSTQEMTDYIKTKYPNLEKGCNRRLMFSYLATFTQLAKSKTRNKKIEKDLLKYIKENKEKVLTDKRIPKRDKIGIYSSMLGIGFYRFVWYWYSKITGRN